MNGHQYIKHIFRISLLLLLIGGIPAEGQEYRVVRDLHLWTGIEIEKTINKDWTLFLAEEVRFKHDITMLNNHLTETGLRYRINKNFALEGQYRITWDKKRDQSFQMLTRYALDLRYKGNLDFLILQYRLRYQKEVEGWKLIDPSIPYEKYVRHRFTLRYNDLKKIKPYASGELFQLFESGHVSRYDYVRVLAGIRYRIPKVGEFNTAFGFNRDFATVQPAMIYMFKVNYKYSLR